MDLGVLEDDNFLDIINYPQIYTLDLWIDTIKIEKGKHKNYDKESVKSLKDEDLSATSIKSQNGEPKKEVSDKSITSNSSKKSQSKLKSQELSKEIRKKYANMYNGTDDYVLPSGQKPLRVRFNIFGMRAVSLTQIEFDKLLHFVNLYKTSPLNGDSYMSLSGSDEDEGKSNDGATQKMNANEKYKRKISGSKNGERRKSSIVHASDANRSGEKSNNSKNNNNNNQDKNSAKAASERKQMLSGYTGDKLDLSEFKKAPKSDIVFNLEETLDLIDEDVFIPTHETSISKGGCVTFSISPWQFITSMQKGPIVMTVDRFGGRNEDEGEPVGEAKIMIPIEWRDSVVKIAKKPLLAPITEKISPAIPIVEKPSGEHIGTMECTLTLTCFSGCVISREMPTQVGLYVAMSETKAAPRLCHKPTSKKNINYEYLRRKAIDEDYEILFPPAKMNKPEPRYTL